MKLEQAKSSAAGFFEEFEASFESARREGGELPDIWIGAGGHAFRLRFATQQMRAAMMPAIEHLTIPPGNSHDLALDIWDTATTGVEPPQPPWVWEKSAPKGEIAELDDPRFAGYVNLESGAISLYDTETRKAIFWLKDVSDLRGNERASPFVQIFQWYFHSAGLQVTHAAVAGTESGAALFAGRSGSGKSTTVALAREAGLYHMADDYCLLGDSPPRVFSFYRSVSLRAPSLQFAPLARHSSGLAWNAWDKSVILRDEKVPAGLPLKLILLPRLTDRAASAARPARPAEALQALAPSSLFQLPGTTAGAFAFFARLTRQLPAFHLDLAGDIENIASIVRDLLKHASDT